MNNARANILNRLKANNVAEPASTPLHPIAHDWSLKEKVARLTECMSVVRTEVHQLDDGNWLGWINQKLPERGLINILVGENQVGKSIIQNANQALQVTRFDRTIEDWKHELFHSIDVGITSTLGAIAETGSLILWPGSQEPRLMSLVPPVHIAILEADKIYATFSEAIDKLNWAQKTPTNALLISGPSKPSDIEQTLAYGIHGPRQLIVLII